MADRRPNKKQKKAKGIAKKEIPPEPITNPVQFLNKEYLSSEHAKKVREAFRAAQPFPHTVLPNVLQEEFLAKVKQELYAKEEWYIKNNDLYTFAQTDDLKNTKLPHVAAIRDIIYSAEFRNFVSDVSGIELNQVIDCSGSRYWKGSTLLCHDDELEGRRIAFIFYLVPPDWKKEDGGCLDLFSVNGAGQPESITTSVVPTWNSFLFFEVTPTSFHQVAEVLADDKDRISINGWFHGAPIVRPPLYVEAQLPLVPISQGAAIELKDWINPRYLQPKMQTKIRMHFEQNSSIELKGFLRENKFNAIQAVLKASGAWKMIGPANRRHYQSIARGALEGPAELVECLKALRSPQISELLGKLTGLELFATSAEARKFDKGSYTLAHDQAEQHDEEGLDAYLFFAENDEWDEDSGGSITYMTEEDELVTIVPTKNSLSLVYRAGAKIMRFVKYLQHSAPYPLIDIAALYVENPANKKSDDEDEDEEDGEGEDGEGGDAMDQDGQVHLNEPERPAAISSDDDE